ncbi:Group XIIA secretory phospholipase A2 [Balamuthia mandrillaris]
MAPPPSSAQVLIEPATQTFTGSTGVLRHASMLGDDLCQPQCPAGQVAVRDPSYVPDVNADNNNCGPGIIENFLPDPFDFTECCLGHDLCWQDCRYSKEQCDQQFYHCMVDRCAAERRQEEAEDEDDDGFFEDLFDREQQQKRRRPGRLARRGRRQFGFLEDLFDDTRAELCEISAECYAVLVRRPSLACDLWEDSREGSCICVAPDDPRVGMPVTDYIQIYAPGFLLAARSDIIPDSCPAF